MFEKRQAYGIEEARLKIYKYCSYQERCHQEVRTKLYEYGLKKNELEELIVDLISQNLLNEERFSKAYCRGKFLHNKWGKVKIRHELNKKQISAYCIKQGFKAISDNEYYDQMASLADNYISKHKAKSEYESKQRTARFLIQKGYESNLVWEYLNEKND